MCRWRSCRAGITIMRAIRSSRLPCRSAVLREAGRRNFMFDKRFRAASIFPLRPGDLMMIDDHQFFRCIAVDWRKCGRAGAEVSDMSMAYDKTLKQCLLRAAEKSGVDLKRGVYMMYTGPQFETPAEIRFGRAIGGRRGRWVSTVPEVIVGRHCGFRICGVSCITNMAAGILDQPLSHIEVTETALKVKDQFAALIDAFLREVKEA